MRFLILALTGLSFSQAQQSGNLEPSRGWFQISEVTPQSRILAASVVPGRLVAGISGSSGVQIAVFDLGRHQEAARWPLSRYPNYLAATPDAIVAGHQNRNADGFEACRYSFDGIAQGRCLAGRGLPYTFVAVGRRFFAVSHDTLWELDFTQESPRTSPLALVLYDGPLLVGAAGEELTRVDSISLQASTVNIRTGQERSFTITTPGLSANRQVRLPQEALVRHLLPRKGGDFWLVYGRYNAFTGLPMDRISQNGDYLGSVRLQIPQFPELKRVPAGNSLIGNPTGHLGTGMIAGFDNRIYVIDPAALRGAWFDDATF